jgi:Lon protease-like protein
MSAHMKALAKRTNPKDICLFPVAGTVLLPGCDLPLNVFEPRYLNMVDDALKGERLIGLVQPLEKNTPDQNGFAGMRSIGALGRICQFAEAEDGRYMIVLRGLKRFRLMGQADTGDANKPYAIGHVSYDEFTGDIEIHNTTQDPEAFSTDKGARGALTMAMKSYANTLGVKLDWDSLKEIPLNRLVDQAAMISPFGADDKQSLLEARTHEDRRRLLIGLMHLYSDLPQDDHPTVQ